MLRLLRFWICCGKTCKVASQSWNELYALHASLCLQCEQYPGWPKLGLLGTLLQDELYSSRIRDFEVFGRQSHPRTEGTDYGAHLNANAWQLLGRFTATNTKGTQAGRLHSL